MRCDRCPHMAAIRRALAPCQSCDNGSHHGCSHVQATDYTLAQRRLDDHTPTAGVTRLDPEDEDILRRAMSTLFGLAPDDLLLVQHLFQGHDLTSFGPALERLHRKLHRYNPRTYAQMAHAKKESITRVFPALAPIFKHVIKPRSTGADTASVRNPDDIGGLI